MIWTHKYISQSRNRFPSSLIVVSPFAILTLFFSYSCCCSHADTHLLSRSMTFFFSAWVWTTISSLFSYVCVVRYSFVCSIPIPHNFTYHITVQFHFIWKRQHQYQVYCLHTIHICIRTLLHTQTHTCGMKQVIDFTQLRNKLTYIKLKIYHT